MILTPFFLQLPHLFDDGRVVGLNDRDGDAGDVVLRGVLAELVDLALRPCRCSRRDATEKPAVCQLELLGAFFQSAEAGVPERIVAVGDEDDALGGTGLLDPPEAAGPRLRR